MTMKSVRDWYGPDYEKVHGNARIERGAGRSELFDAAKRGHKSVLVWLRSVGLLDAMEKDNLGRNVAHWAARFGHESILVWLRTVGLLDAMEKDNLGRNVAHLAAWYGHQSILVWLHSVGLLDALEKDNLGRNIGQLAALRGRISILVWLRTVGLFDAMDDGMNVGHLAASGHESILAWLHSVGLLDAMETANAVSNKNSEYASASDDDDEGDLNLEHSDEEFFQPPPAKQAKLDAHSTPGRRTARSSGGPRMQLTAPQSQAVKLVGFCSGSESDIRLLFSLLHRTDPDAQ